ncbi:MAG: hypothetical protein E2O39_02385 [Planctomycetota bacterium]|nr:MAG: hypothetical protein E2O39_02385 [Planctomycetota bacterium]
MKTLGLTETDPFWAFGRLPDRVNIARYLPEMAAKCPDRPAIIVARGPKADWPCISYGELEERSNAIAHGLLRRMDISGKRVCLFVRPGIDLIAVTYALFKAGAIPVIADPGMGRERLLAVIEKMRPEVFIGIPLANAVRRVFRKSFASVRLAVTVGPRFLAFGPTLEGLIRENRQAGTFTCRDTSADDEAAILFTSGSTGPPKGVTYTHGMFDAQVRALHALYGFRPGEVDLACLPLFALFNTALEMTSVFPELDPSHPAKCDPARIVAAIQETEATTSFGSPAIWRRVVPWCLEHDVRLKTLERVLIAGAPVPPDLIESFLNILPVRGDVYTPYGATEALPVSSISGREIVPALTDKIRGGWGTPIGRPAPGIDLKLIEITDDAIEDWREDLEVEQGEQGEVCVRGPVVTQEYEEDPAATQLAKIRAEGTSPAWHRMGDIAYFDADGLLWFCGRKAHLLATSEGLRTPVPTENVFNVHPRVHRTALVGAGVPGEETPVLVVEPVAGALPHTKAERDRFDSELAKLGRRVHIASDVDTFLYHPGFPVDVRHNAKIDREELKRWAEEQLA